MSNPNQEIKILSQESIGFSLPRLDDVNSTGNCNFHFHSPCASCGGSNKRRSPDSPVLPAENPKKLFLQPLDIPVFSNITLSSPSTQENRIPSPTSLPILRRCLSDPCKPPSSAGMGSSGNKIPVTQSPPESAKIGSLCLTTPASKGTSSLPPRPPVRRCLSDSSWDKSFSLTSMAKEMSVDGNSESQWRRRMRECMKEMSHCLDEEMSKHEEEEEENKASLVTDSEETMCVERTGPSCLKVLFKCSCSKEFEVLLSGTDCYYKLL